MRKIEAVTHEGTTHTATLVGDAAELDRDVRARQSEITDIVLEDALDVDTTDTKARAALRAKRVSLLEGIAKEMEDAGHITLRVTNAPPQ